MIIKTLKFNKQIIWVVIDELRAYSLNNKNIEEKNEFLCYFKLTEPTPYIYGELFRDNENIPIIFNSIQDALTFANSEIKKRLSSLL